MIEFEPTGWQRISIVSTGGTTSAAGQNLWSTNTPRAYRHDR